MIYELQPHGMINEEGPEGMALDAAWEANKAWDTIHTSQATIVELEAIRERHLPGVTIDTEEVDRLQAEQKRAKEEYPGYVAVAGAIFYQPKTSRLRNVEAPSELELDAVGDEILGVKPDLQQYLHRPVLDMLEDRVADEYHRTVVLLNGVLKREDISSVRSLLLRGLDHDEGISDMRQTGTKQVTLLKEVVSSLDPDLDWYGAPNGTIAAKLFSTLAEVPAQVLSYEKSRAPINIELGGLTMEQLTRLTTKQIREQLVSDHYSDSQANDMAKTFKQAATAFKKEFTAERRSILAAHESAQPTAKKTR